MKKKYKVWIFWALMLIGALLVVSQSSYSDGDDAFFYQYTNSMGFGEYLSWRYQTWVGRMSGEAFVYLAFRLGLGFWRVVNAVMLVLLPMGVLRLSEKAAGIGKFLRSGRFLRSDRMRCHSGKLRLRCMLRCSAMCRSDSFRYYMNRRNRKTGYDYVHCYP